MFHTYILQNETGKLYVGQTSNLADRIKRHNSSRSKYTKNKGPWKLIYSKEFSTRSEATALEKKFKSYKNSNYLRKIIAR